MLEAVAVNAGRKLTGWVESVRGQQRGVRRHSFRKSVHSEFLTTERPRQASASAFHCARGLLHQNDIAEEIIWIL